MLVIADQLYFDEVVAFAKKAGLYEGTENTCLKNRLDYLERFGGTAANTRVRLFRDFAPHSFEFVVERRSGEEWRQVITGGLLFHGTHDGNGSGAAPTFASTLTPTVGWMVHT